ncbi:MULTISPECIES: hypothetical protein [unclassified Streptomyces]|uniref:hypothetical protein n=1 Tax=unclassified Streptomyces TaxID=2593676 RepID=UPI0004BDC372|nr:MULTISPECIES: hypothetical protein [unclassified Streptomyces]
MSDQQPAAEESGPVFHGAVSGAQFAWGNDKVTQNQQNNTAPAPAAEALASLASLVADLLRQLPAAGLPDRDREDAEAAAQDVLAEVDGSGQPHPGRLRRALAALKGALAPVATGVAAGTAVGAQEWARTAIESLTSAV